MDGTAHLLLPARVRYINKVQVKVPDWGTDPKLTMMPAGAGARVLDVRDVDRSLGPCAFAVADWHLLARNGLLSEGLLEITGQLLVCPNARDVGRTAILGVLDDRHTLSYFRPFGQRV